jgi:antitoxin (DNA-binding transcriptional repressor) of toxin-antitoxin stability system
MKTMAVSVFKANALQVVARVARLREGLVITKRGKPLVQVVPFQGASASAVPGKLSQTLVFEKDIVAPLGSELWEAGR